MAGDILRPKNTAADLFEEVRDWIGRSPEDHARGLEAACEPARDTLRDHPDRERMLDWSDPLPAGSVAHWTRLVEEARRRRERAADGP